MNILYVDDDNVSMKVYTLLLEKLGYGVFQANSGSSALELLKTECPSVILLDYILPDTDGLQLMVEIRNQFNCHAPIILLTAYGTTNLATEFFKAGGVDFIEKPIREPDLLDTKIRLALERYKRMHAEKKHREDQYRKSILSTVNHEFRTPLTVLRLGVEKLKRLDVKDFEAWKDTTLKKIDEATDQLESIVDTVSEILDLYRLGDITDFMKINTREALMDALYESNLLVRLKEKSLSFENNIQEDTPYMVGNHIYLKEIFQRLIENSVKFTDKGGVTVNARWDDNEVIIEVNDTGIGIESALSEKIFELFEKGDQTGSTIGLGLGLSVVKKLVEQMGGSIQLKTPEQNCCANFELHFLRWKDTIDMNTYDPIIREFTKNTKNT